MSKKNRLGNDHFVTEFHIKHLEPTGKTIRDDSGLPLEDWAVGGGMEQMVTYNGYTSRLDGKWRLHLQWVDLNNEGHRVVLPDGVVKAIFRSQDTILKASKSEGARKAHLTRLDKGTVPDQFLSR